MSPEPAADPRPFGVLVQCAAVLARGADLDVASRELLALAVEATGASLGTVFLQDPDRADLEPLAAVGLAQPTIAALHAAIATDPDHPVARAAGTGAPDLGTEAPALGGPVVVWAHLPLRVARDGIDLPLGAMSIGWPAPHSIDDDGRRLLGAVADLMSVAVDRARLSSLVQERSEWYERLAHTDALTGLANARTLGRVLELEVARASRQGGEVSVAIFDLDDFAALNARDGRPAGDDALREVAAILAGSVRLVDTVARTGSDEFVVVAPGSAGATVARRVIEAVDALPSTAGPRVSVSAGVAGFPGDATSADGLLEAARAALETARAAGSGRMAAAQGEAAG